MFESSQILREQCIDNKIDSIVQNLENKDYDISNILYNCIRSVVRSSSVVYCDKYDVTDGECCDDDNEFLKFNKETIEKAYGRGWCKCENLCKAGLCNKVCKSLDAFETELKNIYGIKGK